MCDPQERESALTARCTRYAAEYLFQFRVHPLYPEVLSRLEHLPGTIYALDIEHVFLEATRQKAARR
ncbi:MAG: hypothetical protein ACT4P8_07790 [Betaproteobacteria bacterium]